MTGRAPDGGPKRTVDVAIAVYGKPFQTAVTLASLFEHCGQSIGVVYLQEEREQPRGEVVRHLVRCFPGRRLVRFVPSRFFSYGPNEPAHLRSRAARQSIRYQYAWERTDKAFLFVTHNDCLYTSDIVSGMLARLADGVFTGVGLIGQCWNCPAQMARLCDGHTYEAYDPSFEEARALVAAHPSPRTTLERIDRLRPMPLPECRLNEFTCLINLEKCRADVAPIGAVEPFGYMGIDLGGHWFRGLRLRGHRFLHWAEGFRHAPFSARGNGHDADDDVDEYRSAEDQARSYLAEHHPELLSRLLDYGCASS